MTNRKGKRNRNKSSPQTDSSPKKYRKHIEGVKQSNKTASASIQEAAENKTHSDTDSVTNSPDILNIPTIPVSPIVQQCPGESRSEEVMENMEGATSLTANDSAFVNENTNLTASYDSSNTIQQQNASVQQMVPPHISKCTVIQWIQTCLEVVCPVCTLCSNRQV